MKTDLSLNETIRFRWEGYTTFCKAQIIHRRERDNRLTIKMLEDYGASKSGSYIFVYEDEIILDLSAN